MSHTANLPFPQGPQAVPMEGWVSAPQTTQVKTYNLFIELPGRGVEQSLDEIKYRFASDFAKHFLADGVINIRSHVSPQDFRTKYEATMSVAPEGMSHIVRPSEKFIHRGIKWSKDDIREALEYTFPERLL